MVFDNPSVYLYSNGSLYIWDLSGNGGRVLNVGTPHLMLTGAGNFIVLYMGVMYPGGGTSNALYVYSNGSLGDVLDQLEALFPEPPPKTVDVFRVVSNGTSALLYVKKPHSLPEEPGYPTSL